MNKMDARVAIGKLLEFIDELLTYIWEPEEYHTYTPKELQQRADALRKEVS